MKSYIVFIVFIVTSIIIAQENQPIIKFDISENAINPYLKKLGIVDEKSIIVRYWVTNAWVTGNAPENYLVLLPNGSMFKYAGMDIVKDKYFNSEWTIRKIEVTDANEKDKYLKLINKIGEIDKGQLNLTVKDIPVTQGDTSAEQQSMSISDANDFTLEIYKEYLKLTLKSYAPEEYIEEQFNGFRMRQKFLDILREFDFQSELFGK